MEQYGSFAYIYDELMDDVDYEKWVKHIENIIEHKKIKVKNILELACGTGNITLPLAQKGYDIAGIDISEEMLDVAFNKSEEVQIPLVLLQQDIVDLDFDLYDLDCVLCACDGFNYITSPDDLKKLAETAWLLQYEEICCSLVSRVPVIKQRRWCLFSGLSGICNRQ